MPAPNATVRSWLLLVMLGLFAAVVVTIAVSTLRPWDREGALAAQSSQTRRGLAADLTSPVFAALSVTAALICTRAQRPKLARALLALGLLALVVLLVRVQQRRIQAARLPHVLVVTIDGFNAERMAIYGAARAPTPYLDRLAHRGLWAERFFPSACCTTGGILSLLTSRVPLELRTHYPPQQLARRDQYRGLPILLRSLGYRTLQLTEQYYSDANDLGLRGFDQANGWRRDDIWVDRLPVWARGLGWAVQELRHVWLGDEPEVAPLGPVMEGHYFAQGKLDTLLAELDGANGPLFAHLHLLESHGPIYDVETPVYSVGKQPQPWSNDSYDDSLRELDAKVADLFYQLGVRGLLDKVIVVISSDHGKRWAVDQPIPLFIVGRGVEPRRIGVNTQSIDLPPTLLNLLGEPVPPWMSGRSLTGRAAPEAWRIILSAQVDGATRAHGEEGRWEVAPQVPNKGVAKVHAILCDRHFVLDLHTGELSERLLEGRGALCPPATVPRAQSLLRPLLDYLAGYGYAPLRPATIGKVL